MNSSSALRQAFLDFFARHEHTVFPSASLIPHHDPTLLLTTAGMVPFKDIFTGKETRPCPRATSSQKCVRAGGKHNDLDEVGHTARHHTFFEMLGNFSFGDYFKDKAITYAWTFLTKELQLDPNRLLITVYHTDDEAFNLWRKIAGIPEHRIIRIATADNFWAMGDTGPCGPCSEIFYDHGDSIAGGPPGSANADGDRFVELWNLVFMSFDQPTPGTKVPLPYPSVDTGMGLERAAAVLQGVHDNFDTDILRTLIERSGALSGTSVEGIYRIAHRVIADHLRSSSFLMADGLLPDNEGRGYILRRIIRRALRHVHHIGGTTDHLAQLVPTLVDMMGTPYAELSRAAPLITSVLTQEAERFQDLLNRGLTLLKDWIPQVKAGHFFPGHLAFQLYDTYGFPLDMTQDILKESGIFVDEAAFYACMQAQKEKSRQSWIGSGQTAKEDFWIELSQTIRPTVFTGYEATEDTGTIQVLIHQGVAVPQLMAGQEGLILTDKSPFYGESGGQIGDTGWIESPRVRIIDTQKRLGLTVHKGVVESGMLMLNTPVTLCVDSERRQKIRANHSATHLLQAALRHILGPHVTQKGSLVTDEKLRFDFSHPHPLSLEDIERIEHWVNAAILANYPVDIRWMDQKTALEEGAMALFGEKYEDVVRVIQMANSSKELCGGTHVARTGDIGLFKVLQESGVSAGVRRIEAVTAEGALALFQTLYRQAKSMATLLKTGYTTLQPRLETLLTQRKPAVAAPATFSPTKETIGPYTLWTLALQDHNPKELKPIIDQLKAQMKSGIILLTNAVEDKLTVLIGLTADLTNRLNATHLLSMILPKQGGGRPDLAQGGGSFPQPALVEALKAALLQVS